MEESLSARQFIERFHLPQLVRISSLDTREGEQSECDAGAKSNEPSSMKQKKQLGVNKQSPRPFLALAGSSNVGASKPSARHQLEQSDADWTYAPGKCGPSVESSGSKSLHWAPRELADEQVERSGHSSLMMVGQQARSNLRLLPRVKIQARTNVELDGPRTGEQTTAPDELRPPRSRREPEIRLMPATERPALSKLQLEQPFLLYKAYRKLEVCAYAIDLNNELNDKSGDPIFFPHNYQGWFTLLPSSDSNCPAARRPPEHNLILQQPLENIDQVCHTSSQTFLTRDELVGFQLPSKLSQLTKLKNHQLLAVPLAINLESNKQRRHLAASEKGSQEAAQRQQKTSKSGAGISNLETIVIPAGQVLRICGIYEDVLPLIERNSSLVSHFKKPAQQHEPAASQASESHQTERMCHRGNPYAPAAHQASVQLSSQQAPGAPSSGPARREQRLEMLRESRHQNGCQQQTYGSPRVISPQGTPVAPPLIYSKQANNLSNVVKPLSVIPTRRYARCVLLSDESLDRMTGCWSSQSASRSQERVRQQQDLQTTNQDTAQAEPPEIEVLVPVDQVGRFYLCATSQTLASEWLSGCQDCSLLTGSQRPATGQLVFRLSQIIYLVNLNKRLSAGAPTSYVSNSSASSCSGSRSMQPMQQQQQRPYKSWRPLSSSFTLPLQVELVVGPRPANFSPSMFGLTSTMESHFSREPNVGAHAIGCKLNRSSLRAGPRQAEVIKPARANAPICSCPQEVKVASSRGSEQQLVWFSATLRLESITKRDVLLACTIKKAPLEKLDTLSGGGDSNRGGERQDVLGESVIFADRQTSKSIGPKSSLSRLRACRSLISLNGRKKRDRPQIPSSMMIGCDSTPQGGANNRAERGNRKAVSSYGNELHSSNGQPDESGASQTPIIMLEFDCNDPDLRLKRTFVEQSLPSASIPDLVLKRMEFCQANSSCWERQLKLSNRSLSRDFDAHRGELLAAQRARESHEVNSSRRHQLASDRAKSLSQSFLQRCQFDACSYQRTIKRSSASSYVNSAGGLSSESAEQRPVGSSTGSSRSSSGVSSSGEHLHRLLTAAPGAEDGAGRKSPAKSDSSSSLSSGDSSIVASTKPASGAGSDQRLGGLSQAANEFTGADARVAATRQQQDSSADGDFNLQPRPQAADLSSCSSSANSLANGPAGKSSSSRLLRLVHKILPMGVAGKPLECLAAREPGDKRESLKAAPAHSQRRLLMAELNGRFKTHQLSSGQKARDAAPGEPTTTLMNSQKLHRRLMIGSVRHLPAELMDSLMQQDQDEEAHHNEQEEEGERALDRAASASSSSSHLYESLERLNESLALAGQKVSGAAAKAHATPNRFQSSAGAMARRQHVRQASELPDAEGLPLVASDDEPAASRLERQMRRTIESNDASGGAETRVGFGQRAPRNRLEAADECWRTSSSNDDDERAPTDSSHRLELAAEAAAKKLSSGKAQAKRIALSWRQKLVASAGRRRSNANASQAGEQLTSLPAELHLKGHQKQRRHHLPAADHKMDRCRDVDHKLDMEPVSIEACDGPEIGASSGDELADQSETPPNNGRGDAPTSSAHFFPPSSGSTCSSGRAAGSHPDIRLPFRERQRRARSAQKADESIYVNMASNNGGAFATTLSAGKCVELERLAEGARQKSRGTQQLVSRMERKLAKLRGRCDLRQQVEHDSERKQSSQLRSLGWEPAHELTSRLPSRNASTTRSCDFAGPMSLPSGHDPSGGARSHGQQRPSSSLSSASSINFSSSSSQADSSCTLAVSSSGAGGAIAMFAHATPTNSTDNNFDDEHATEVNRICLRPTAPLDERRQVAHGNSRDLSATYVGGELVAPSSDLSSSSSSSGERTRGHREQKVASSVQPAAQMWQQRLITLDRAANVQARQQLEANWTRSLDYE